MAIPKITEDWNCECLRDNSIRKNIINISREVANTVKIHDFISEYYHLPHGYVDTTFPFGLSPREPMLIGRIKEGYGICDISFPRLSLMPDLSPPNIYKVPIDHIIFRARCNMMTRFSNNNINLFVKHQISKRRALLLCKLNTY